MLTDKHTNQTSAWCLFTRVSCVSCFPSLSYENLFVFSVFCHDWSFLFMFLCHQENLPPLRSSHAKHWTVDQATVPPYSELWNWRREIVWPLTLFSQTDSKLKWCTTFSWHVSTSRLFNKPDNITFMAQNLISKCCACKCSRSHVTGEIWQKNRWSEKVMVPFHQWGYSLHLPWGPTDDLPSSLLHFLFISSRRLSFYLQCIEA